MVGSGKWEVGPKHWWDVDFNNKLGEVELMGGGLSTLVGYK